MAASLSSDILIPDSVPTLELPKHIEFLAKYGTVKDDYVSACCAMLINSVNVNSCLLPTSTI